MKRALYSGVIPGVISRNRHEVDGDIVRVYLNGKGEDKVAQINLSDAARVLSNNFKWVCDSNGYVKFNRPGSLCLYMHRLVVEAPKGKFVDHTNHDRLDNRRSNLRIVTNAQNLQNRIDSKASSGIKNVNWHSTSEKWLVRVMVAGKRVHCGLFETLEAAAAAASEARRKYHTHCPENSVQSVQEVSL